MNHYCFVDYVSSLIFLVTEEFLTHVHKDLTLRRKAFVYVPP